MLSSDSAGSYKSIFESVPAAIVVADTKGAFIRVNSTFCSLLGYSQEEAIKLSLNDVMMPEDRKANESYFRQVINSEAEGYHKLMRFKRKNGRCFWANLSVSAMPDEDGRINSAILVFQDIDTLVENENTLKDVNKALESVNNMLINANAEIQKKNNELQKAYIKLDELARTDILTGLPNRRQLEEQLLMESRRTKRTLREFCICIADIDGFKRINDTYGHDVGDMVLKDIARIFRENTRVTDVIGRWGGEEFMFILPETPVDGAMVLMERIRQYVMNHVIKNDELEFSVTVTLGFSTFLPGNLLEEVLKQADLALYAGKKSGKNIAIRYTKELKVIQSI
jgi:diguanylate cyclase (GGDEF)-like protein/PAS domain S-box-containing protein